MNKTNWTNKILWLVYIGLLAVLLPHTAWMFLQFEPVGDFSTYVAWAAAFTFEAAIAVLTHKLAQHIDKTPRYSVGRVWLKRLGYRYANAYAFSLITAVAVSTIANVSHAMQYATEGFGTPWHVAAFGGVLPFASLMFARVLSSASDEVQEVDVKAQKMRKDLQEVRKNLQGKIELLKVAEIERAEIESQLQQTASQLQEMTQYRNYWQTINPKTQVAIMYNAGEIKTLQEAANGVNLSESTISRIASSINGRGS